MGSPTDTDPCSWGCMRGLVRYLRLNEVWLLISLRDAGISITRAARRCYLIPTGSDGPGYGN